MASRPVAETIASIEAEDHDAARTDQRRSAAITQALNWFGNRGELQTVSTSEVLGLARRYCEFIEVGATNPLESADALFERLRDAQEIITGWLSYVKSDVVQREVYVNLVGDSTLFLSEADS